MRELDALRSECQRIEATLRGIAAEDWSRPGLGEWDLHTLATHLTRTVGRVIGYLDLEPPEGPAELTRVTMYRYDVGKVAPDVAQRARNEAADLPPEQLPEEFGRVWRAAVDKAAGFPADHLVRSPFGSIELADYLATRTTEAVVHHMDVRRALDLPPDPSPDAADVVVEILEGLLGGPRPRNLGRDRFILVATGRIGHDDPRFPVLA